MAYDQELADRIRQLTSGDRAITEKAMFGGLAFLVDGKMAVAAGGKGDLLVRVGRADMADLMATTSADVAVMGSREMRGWVTIEPEHLETDSDLSFWVRRGVAHARTLPAKN
ncbi:TfoX/Sxy family protein [Rhodococcus sp. NPDC058521]|uniref:TfoX/Sxy family protein n=1 Tax=Rhodococcus sp. NPDC058521 TaxID=3346536 RepID=UPI0036612385